MSDAIRAAVSAILESAGITFGAIYRGEKKRDDWQCDAWKTYFVPRAGHRQEFEFFTGLGLRAEPTAGDRRLCRLPGLTEKDITQRTIYGRRYLAALEAARKPQAPHAADVLHSLILDSSATEQSFGSWCGELGYDSDSRKAERTYRACQENSDNLRRVFSRDVLAQLFEALQEY